MANRLAELTRQNAEQQQALREGVATKMEALRTENTAKLEQMRLTMDKLISDQLEQVYKSVGEMQTLATAHGLGGSNSSRKIWRR